MSVPPDNSPLLVSVWHQVSVCQLLLVHASKGVLRVVMAVSLEVAQECHQMLVYALEPPLPSERHDDLSVNHG